MYVINDIITPQELTGYAREASADFDVNQFILSRWLPTETIDDLDYRFERGGGGLVEAAVFRGYDTPTPFGARPGTVRVSGSLPPISRQLRLSEYDRIRLRNGNNAERLRSQVFNDAENVTKQIMARMELARGEALYSGKVILNENGVQATVDFARNASLTATEGTVWSNVAAPIPTSLRAHYDTYISINGRAPGAILTSTSVKRNMQKNTALLNLVAGSAAGRVQLNDAELNGFLESEGLPPITTYDAQVSVGGVATRIIPVDRLLFLPAPGETLGATLSGITSEALEPEYGLQGGDEPGIVAGVYKSADPVAVFTKAAAIKLPVLGNADLTMSIDVQ
jgi:hypothetical protein